jgi:hypothetical protein
MVNTFVERLNQGATIEDALKPALQEETDLRKLWATDRSNSAISDPFAGLIDVFDAPTQLRQIQSRTIAADEQLNAEHIFPLPEDVRKTSGSPATVANFAEFMNNWSVFSEGSLVQLKPEDWKNVIAAGGSVLACVEPLSKKDGETRRAMRKYYHSKKYPTSDVDLFLWGLTPEQVSTRGTYFGTTPLLTRLTG